MSSKKQTYADRIRAYEDEKQKILQLNLSPQDYEQRLREIAEKYRI